MCLLDDFSRYLQVFVMKTKTQTPECLDQGYAEVQRKYPGQGQFSTLRCDKGSEFTSEKASDILEKYGAKQQIHMNMVEHVNGLTEQFRREYMLSFSSLAFTVLFGDKLHMLRAGCTIVLLTRQSTL